MGWLQLELLRLWSKKSPEGASDVVTRKYAVAEVYGVNA